MKKLLTGLSAFLLFSPLHVFAADGALSDTALGNTLPLWSCIPFAGMLLSIAIFPLIKEEWWEKHKPWVVAFWSLLFLIPFAVIFGGHIALEHLIEVTLGDYLTFIVLLFGLFCVAGNISLQGDLTGSPKVNVVLLLIGTLLSSWIGTTGASMLMIRPIIRANKWRQRKVQIMVFFIFLISNIGGCLTPVGDPPLLMGFMNGVGFFWSLNLLPVMLLNVLILLTLFFLIDTKAYKKDIADGFKPEIHPESERIKLHLDGAHNIAFMLIIVAAVILSGVLPTTFPVFSEGPTIMGVTLSYASIIEIIMILASAYLSFKTTKKEIRDSNHFTWDAIEEVAILFIGIFITMIPALLILKARGADLGLTQPWQFFWITGALSSFLDNTPTYLVFFTTAASLGFSSGVQTLTSFIPKAILMAISCGAVFMGANTYIGNAPNFMVKAISDENGIKMPSFFGYLLWSVTFLVPVFLLDMLVFFL